MPQLSLELQHPRERTRYGQSSAIVSALSRAVNNGDARIPPAIPARPPLSRRQLLIVRSDLAGYIQSFVPSRPSVSAFVSGRRRVLCAWLATRWPTPLTPKERRAHERISIRREGVIAFVALRKLSRPIATWAAWEIILRCGEREPADRRTEVEPLGVEIGNLVTSPLSRCRGRHGFTLDEGILPSIINFAAVHSDSLHERVEFWRTH